MYVEKRLFANNMDLSLSTSVPVYNYIYMSCSIVRSPYLVVLILTNCRNVDYSIGIEHNEWLCMPLGKMNKYGCCKLASA